jgi:hypothetical protein
MARDFLERDKANTLTEKMPRPPPEDSEEWKG